MCDGSQENRHFLGFACPYAPNPSAAGNDAVDEATGPLSLGGAAKLALVLSRHGDRDSAETPIVADPRPQFEIDREKKIALNNQQMAGLTGAAKSAAADLLPGSFTEIVKEGVQGVHASVTAAGRVPNEKDIAIGLIPKYTGA